MLHKSSCFLDCLALLLAEPIDSLHRFYMAMVTDQKPEETGYHPQIFAFRLSFIEIAPCGTDGLPVISLEQAQERFDAVCAAYSAAILVGPRLDTGSEHANLLMDGTFWCPVEGMLESPNIGIRSAWVKR
jgi:hypothetical protein